MIGVIVVGPNHHVGIGADWQQALKSKGTLIQHSARLFAAQIRAILDARANSIGPSRAKSSH
jgi:hypothetical protein